MTIRNYFFIVPLIFLLGCISAEQTTEDNEKKNPEVYVFDDIKEKDEVKLDTVKANVETKAIEPTKPVVVEYDKSLKYTVQVGAFTSKERADVFVKENQNKTSLPLQITFNVKTNLFSVQIPHYKTKEEADTIRDNLRKFNAFKDSFTVLVEN